MKNIEILANASHVGAAVQPVNGGMGGDDQVQNPQISQTKRKEIEQLEKFKQRFPNLNLCDNGQAPEILDDLLKNHKDVVPDKLLFGMEIKSYNPNSASEFMDLISVFGLDVWNDELNFSRHKCSRGQFEMRKFLLFPYMKCIGGDCICDTEAQKEQIDFDYIYYSFMNVAQYDESGIGTLKKTNESIQSIIDDLKSGCLSIAEKNITFSVKKSTDEEGLYYVSFECPEVGAVSEIGIHSTIDNIDLDAIGCVIDNLKIAVDLARKNRVVDSIDNPGEE